MNIKKVISASLCACMALGFTGCIKPGKKVDDKEALQNLTKDYVKAVQDYDEEALFKLTDWEKDDQDYKEAKALFNVEYGSDAEERLKVNKYLASTVKVTYEDIDFDVKENEATLLVTYELTQWNEVFNEPSEDYDEVISRLKEVKETRKEKGKISFSKAGDEWKISQLPHLVLVYKFALATPQIFEPQPTGTETEQTTEATTTPVTEGTTPLSKEEEYKFCIASCISVLKANIDDITAVQREFKMDAVGFYDMNGDGLPELYYFVQDGSNAKFVVRSYLPYAGEMVESITFPFALIKTPSDTGFVVYLTDDEIVLTWRGGANSVQQFGTQIYSLKDFTLKESYVVTQKVSSSSPDKTYECTDKDGKAITWSEYNKIMSGYVSKNLLLIYKNYSAKKDDPEYPFNKDEPLGLMSYDEALSYFESEK